MISTSNYKYWQSDKYTTYSISLDHGDQVDYQGNCFSTLAPKLSFWKEWYMNKNIKRMSEEENNRYYVEQYYKQVLSKLDPLEIYQTLDNSILLSYDDDIDRHIVAAWFEILLDIKVPEQKAFDDKVEEVERPKYIKEYLEDVIRKNRNMRGFNSLRALYLFEKGEQLEQEAKKIKDIHGDSAYVIDAKSGQKVGAYESYMQKACFLRCDADEAEQQYNNEQIENKKKIKEFERIENDFYDARYGMNPASDKDVEEMWNKIKNQPEVLEWAIKIKRNKWNDGDILNGITIADAMLIDYKNVDEVVYNKLINTIYTNRDIARICLNGTSFNTMACSFLLMSLWNEKVKLTEEQKRFIESEALCDNTPVHFYGIFDIRYQILRNSNWTFEEKQRLVMDFYSDEDYDEVLEQWEWAIVNDRANYKGENFPPFDRYELFNNWTYEMLLKYHNNKEVTDRIWAEMEFCKQMHNLRPQQLELGNTYQRTLD